MSQSTDLTPSYSRRQFTRGGLATALAAGVAPSFHQALAQGSGKKLGLAIVGLGGYATGCIAPEIASCEHVTLAGVVTGNPDTKGKEVGRSVWFPRRRNLHIRHGRQDWRKTIASTWCT